MFSQTKNDYRSKTFILLLILCQLLLPKCHSFRFLTRLQHIGSKITTTQRMLKGSIDSTTNSNTTSTSITIGHLDPILIKGYKFFNSRTGENILIKGIDYYPRPNTGELDFNSVDFFTEEYRHIWERDIPQFQALGVNAIRLYSVDPLQDHSAFMCALNNAGIYVMVELASGSCPSCAILSKKAPDCYPSELKIRGELVIKEFSKYTNTLAFSAGNEVNHFVPFGKSPEWNAPCLKKFVKDMRVYVSKCDHIRHIPIGLIMADSDREVNTLYYNCQSDEMDDMEHAEWYGINTYVYCNGSATELAHAEGFMDLSTAFESYNYSIPVLLTEYGCLSKSFPTIGGYQGQRNFNQAKWLGNPSIQNDFAGGMTFEYSIEAANANPTPWPFKKFGEQNYGVGYFSPKDCDDVNIPCEYIRTPSFYNLKSAYAQAHADNITIDEFAPSPDRTGRSLCPPQFPKLNSFHWKTDWKISASCPPKSHETYTCPATNSQSKHTEHYSRSNGIVMILISILLVVFAISHKTEFLQIIINALNINDLMSINKESESDSNEEDDEASELIDYNYNGRDYDAVGINKISFKK